MTDQKMGMEMREGEEGVWDEMIPSHTLGTFSPLARAKI